MDQNSFYEFRNGRRLIRKIKRSDVRRLQAEAADHGDTEMARLCREWLDRDDGEQCTEAGEAIWAALEYARAQSS